MISSILTYELRNRFTHWTTILIVLALIFQGIWYTKGTFDYYVNEDMLMNASAIFYKNLAGGGILMIIIVAIITGGVLYKDIEHKTSQWIYTMPIKEKRFFLGRFLSAYLINVILALGYVIGMLLVPYAGIGEAHRFGPAPIWQLLQGFALLLMPNLFLLTSLIFALIIASKRMAAGYLGVLVTTVLFLVMQTTSEAGGATPLLQLTDPFGYVATETLLDTLTSKEKNTGFLPLSGYWLANRLLWLGVSLLMIAWAYRGFSFKKFIGSKKAKKTVAADQTGAIPAETNNISVDTAFSTGIFFRKLWTLSRLEFSNVIRPMSFRVVLGIILLVATLQNLLWNDSYYIGNTVPLTSGMTLFRLSFGVFIMILLMVWAGELFFKDKTVKIWQITDTLPVPVWVTQLSKFVAMIGVSFLLAFSFMLLGVIAQVLKGGAGWIDLSLFAYDLLGFNWGWLTYVLQIALVFFIAGLTGNRFFTHILSVGILFGTIMAFELGLAEQTIYAYGAVPGLEDYSEMSGYGIWLIAAPWYFLMWALLAITFVCLGILFWERGTGHVWYKKFLFTGKQLSWIGKGVALIALIAFVGVRAKIKTEVNDKGNFVSSEVEEADAADYERRYAFLKEIDQPKYRAVDLAFDFYPQDRKATYNAEIQLVSSDTTGVKTLFLNFPNFVSIEGFTIKKGKSLSLQQHDERHDLYVFEVPENEVNDTLNLVLKATKQYLGFTQSGAQPQADLTFKGAFGNIRDFLPVIGYQEDKVLDENRKREDHGLAKLSSRMASVDDEKASRALALTPDAHLVSGTIQLSTSAGQQPLAPGKMKRSWLENDRNYASYEIAAPSTFNWQLGSFETNPRKGKAGELDYAIWVSARHLFNLDLYERALIESYKFVRQTLGDITVQEVRLVEIPYYQEKYYAFPNTIAISEKEGWYADTTGLAEKAYIHQTVASQMIKLWLYEHLQVANVQGADMLLLALPEALALHHIKETLGQEVVDLILQKKKDLYNKNRFNEPNQEPSLRYADGTDYLEENKGAIELYHLSKKIGTHTFISTLNEWMAMSDQPRSFESFYEVLIANLRDSESVRNVFEDPGGS